MSEELVLPIPNNPLPYRIMDPVTKEDGIPADAIPPGIRDQYKRRVLWEWSPAVYRMQFHWLSRDHGMIVVSWHTYDGDDWPVHRQSYLRRKGDFWEWADIISPDVQDAIRNWLALGALAGDEKPGRWL